MALILSEHVFDKTPYHYKVRPAGTNEVWEVSHWDIDFDRNVVESRCFSIVSRVKPGVIVKTLDDNKLHQYMGNYKTSMGESIDGVVEIMVRPDLLPLTESMIR